MPISVKEVIKTAAELIGDGDLAKTVEEGSSSSEELSLLLKCFNLVENEVALDYFPLKTCETFTPAGGLIYFTSFSEPPIRLISVTDGGGCPLAYERFFDRIDLHGYGQKVEVTYAFAPVTKTLEGNSDYAGRVSARLLACGVATEYLLAAGRYAEASAFNQKYRDALRAAAEPGHKLTVRARRWA